MLPFVVHYKKRKKQNQSSSSCPPSFSSCPWSSQNAVLREFTPLYTLFLTLSCFLSKQCHSHTQHRQGLLLTHTHRSIHTDQKKKHVLNCNAQAGRWVALIFCEQYSKTFPASLSLVCRIYIRVHPAAAPPDRLLRVHYMSVFPPYPVILNVCGRLWFRWLL